MYLLEYYELVAVGEFDSFPEGSPDDFSLLNPRDVLVEFRILKRYQGMSADSIQVELISDMLVFPGEDLSRYAKRQQVRWGQIKEAEAIRRQLETLERSLEAGEIALQEYEEETTKISVLQEQLTRDSLATSTRLIGLVHSETSYDLGGAIRPDETYLIGVNKTLDRNHVYMLEEVPRSVKNIFWGETRDDLIAALDALTR